MLNWSRNLEKYLNSGLNVLLCGEAGVGKTAVIKEIFDKNFGDEWLYIAGSTVDPFLDLVGIPRATKDENGNEFLEYIKPKKLQLNKVQAIFCDEYNRAPKKVMNFLMSVIQFGEINGEKLSNLKVVWAAVNPDSGDYNTEEKIDRAQKDRFQIYIDVPYLLDTDYFKSQHPNTWDVAAEWWNDLDENSKKLVSPRKLDHALTVYNIKGDLRDVLEKEVNISKLVDGLKFGTIQSQIEKLLALKDDKEIKDRLSKSTNLMTKIKESLNQDEYIKKFAHLLPEEIITEKAPHNFALSTYIKTNSNKFEPSLIGSLDGMGCFKESDFRVAFTLNDKYFNNGYKSQKRAQLHKVFQALPLVHNVKIRTADIVPLQKLLDVISTYLSYANYYTPERDDAKYKFMEKLADLRKLNAAQSLGLNFNQLDWRINNFETKRAAEQMKAYSTSTTTTTINPILRAGTPLTMGYGNTTYVASPNGTQTVTVTI